MLIISTFAFNALSQSELFLLLHKPTIIRKMCNNYNNQLQSTMNTSSTNQSQPVRKDEFTNTVLCETIFEKESSKQVNTRDLSPSAAAALKASDAFMYYSVPTLRRAALLNKDSDVNFQVHASSGSSSMDVDDGHDGETSVVKRQTRVSTECHPDFMFEEYYSGLGNGDDTDCEEDSDDEEEDFLMAVVAAKASLDSST